jgi:redox-sensitive bicupin YhaK (pirin superfamily)
MSGLDQRVLLAPDDGSLGPLLRVSDDRLPPGAGYGRHEHRAVDVVAVVDSGAVHHRWADGVTVRAGEVAVLRSGTGLNHDEVAGDDGAHLLQCYLRPARPDAPPTHEVHGANGWVDLARDDARLWAATVAAGERVDLPEGLRLVVTAAGSESTRAPAGEFTASEPTTVLVWQLDDARPAWARD